MNSPQLIRDQAELHELVRHLGTVNHLGIDTESNSFYAYKPRICLIQISVERSDFIVDPLALEDLSPLNGIFSDPAVEKILHAADNDVIGLQREFGFRLHPIFDTAIACRLLGRRQLGLAGILAEEFEITTDKHLQRCDWQRRPLTPEQIFYAQLDTHFLIPLRHRLYRRLLEKNLWSAALREFARLEQIRPKPVQRWRPDGYLRLKGADRLSPISLQVLRALFSYRERLARKADRAPFRIMNNEVLVRLAQDLPRDRTALSRVRGLPSQFRGRKAAELLRILHSGKG
jgi:ribonuclease D